jgi:hypothetical protein
VNQRFFKQAKGSIGGGYQPGRWNPSMRKPKKQKKPLNDLSRSLTPFDANQTLITVVSSLAWSASH